MVLNPFKFKIAPKSFLGIDIGVSSIKIVELSQWGGRMELKNYGQVFISSFKKNPSRTLTGDTFSLSTEEISKTIKAILKEANINTKGAAFTLPDFSTFFTSFELPSMSKEELPEAVNFEARQHIPVPLSEVVLDWYLTDGKISGKGGSKLKILLVAVPNDLVAKYQDVARESGIELKYLEAEAFSLTRALARNTKDTVCLLDIGAQSTTVNVADEGILKVSHSFDVSGDNLTFSISKSFNVDSQKAELLKKKYGLEYSETKDLLYPFVNLIIIEVDKILKDFYLEKGKEIQKIIIAGGSAILPGLGKYLSSYFKKEVIIADPFSDIFYPSNLEDKLKKTGPSFTVAIGAALRGFL